MSDFFDSIKSWLEDGDDDFFDSIKSWLEDGDDDFFDSIKSWLEDGDDDFFDSIKSWLEDGDDDFLIEKGQEKAFLAWMDENKKWLSYSVVCDHCNHKWTHDAKWIPGAVFATSCPECNRIKAFIDTTKTKHGHQKSRLIERAIIDVFLEQGPRLTVRQVYYALTVRNAIPKTQGGYRSTCYHLKNMRLRGQLPYGWIADNTRWQIRPTTYTGLEAALFNMQELYRRNLWEASKSAVEIWVEKDALAGVITPVTREYDVPLFVARGYSSMTFIYDAAQEIKESGKPTYIYHFGDYDPSGVDAAYKIRDELRKHGANIFFERAAVTEAQIQKYDLPTRATKTKDTRAAKWGNRPSVELDAIPANLLRDLVRDCIEKHIDQSELERLEVIENQEKETLSSIRKNLVQVQKNLGGMS